MIRQALSFAGLLFLGGAVTLATPGSGLAQHGGGHGGGGHAGGGFSGGHFGGAHFGGGYGGFHPGYYGGRGRSFYGGYSPFYYGGYYPYSYGYGVPYYTGYDTSDYSYGDAYLNSASVPPYDPAGTTQSLYLPPTQSHNGTSAHVTVRVPADARLWFEDAQTTTTGAVREFSSPSLTPGTKYTYTVRATWNENGHEVTQTQQVGVTAGARVTVDFPEKSEVTNEWSATPTR